MISKWSHTHYIIISYCVVGEPGDVTLIATVEEYWSFVVFPVILVDEVALTERMIVGK